MKLENINLENEYLIDMITHNGFVIESKDKFAPINIEALINSDKYMDTEYSCDCGAFIGQDIIGQKCPCCHSEISLHSLNFRYTGWINLKQHHVIAPKFYIMLKRALGIWMLRYILGDYKSDISIQYNENDVNFEENKKNKKSGRVSQNDIAYIEKKIPKSKMCYKGIGHDEFYNRFEEVIDVCANKNSNEVEFLKANKRSVFTTKIPVYSTAFRPTSKTSETMFYPKINKYFAMICSVAERIDSMSLPIEKIQALNCIQNNMIEAGEHLVKSEISKKEGLVRSEIVGGTFEFSARGVITLDTTLRADEVDLPYNMFVLGYQFKITHMIATRCNITLEQAYLMSDGCSRDPIVVAMANEILATKPCIFIIREPTNNIKSIEMCIIRSLKFDDDTISLPNEPLSGFNADFDGDQLNLGFIPKEVEYVFEPFRFSCLTNYITEKVDVDLLEWSDICLGIMSE